MQQISHQAEAIFYKVLAFLKELWDSYQIPTIIPELISEFWEFIAAGLLLLLLLILLFRLRRSRGADGGSNQEIEFFDLEQPAIVYGKEKEPAEQEAEETETKPARPSPLPKSLRGGNFLEVDHRPVIVYRKKKKADPEPEQVDPSRQAEAAPAASANTHQRAIQPPAPPPPAEPAPSREAAATTSSQLTKPEAAPANAGHNPPSEPAAPRHLPYLESDLANEVLRLFHNQGFKMDILYQGQYGADLIATGPGGRSFVQVKDWKKKVKDIIVQEAYKYANANGCSRVVIVSDSFDRAAIRAAKKYEVAIWTKKTLQKQQKNFTLSDD